jgi:ABC-type nitrate/sulfonate/bicarbonate transport system substrate-binding protein
MSFPPLKAARAILIAIFASTLLAFSVPIVRAASAPAKITIHVPGKTLAVMAFYFKGFFAQEGIDAQLVAMAPPARCRRGELKTFEGSSRSSR